MKRLLELVAEHWPLEMPRAHLRRELGDDAVERVEQAGLASRAAVLPGAAYPCPHSSRLGCQREVLGDGVLVARCTSSPAACADEPIEEDDAVWLRVGASELVPRLQRALGLEVAPVAPSDGPMALGARRVGRSVTDFVLAWRPTHERVLGNWDPNRVNKAAPRHAGAPPPHPRWGPTPRPPPTTRAAGRMTCTL